MKRATVSLWADTDFAHGALVSLGAHVAHMDGTVVILPSSLDPHDTFGTLAQRALPESVESEIVVPVTGSAARRAFVTPMVLGSWIDRPVANSDAGLASVTLPQKVAQADHRLLVADVVEIARQGPFVLDLAARYVHPRQRMKLLASSQRDAVAAEVASAMPMDLYMICLAQREGLAVATTTDAIAAELTALAMSELCHGAPRSFAGPWEDAVVQRATELEIGVTHPSYLRIVEDGPDRSAHWAQRIIEHLHLRLGVPFRRT